MVATKKCVDLPMMLWTLLLLCFELLAPHNWNLTYWDTSRKREREGGGEGEGEGERFYICVFTLAVVGN